MDLPEPPATYAHVRWDPAGRVLEFEYNHRAVISIDIPGRGEVKYRIASDGLLQSSPPVQQTFVGLAAGQVEARVTFHMSAEAIAMRLGRAQPGQAIVGTLGGATVPGVNGLYDVLDDLLIEWHGQPWRWLSDKLQDDGRGGKRCSLAVRLTDSPWLVNLRPMYYRRHLGYRYHAPWQRRPDTKPVAGWCSWEAYRREVSEEKVLRAAEFLAESVGKYGLEYIQLDDGYQRLPVKYPVSSSLADAWLIPNDNFPSGLGTLCEKIKSLGFQPGVWVSADAEEIEPADDGSDVRLRRPDGEAITGFWMRAIPDCLPETIEKHIVPLYRGIVEKGFRYVKIDQIRHLLADALHEAVREGVITNREAQRRFRDYMAHCRSALGDDVYLLASWGVLSEVVGLADACRIAADATTTWNAVRMQVVESARWWHCQRILFLNDPDHVCVRTKPDWARSLLSLVSLSGQLLMLSDPPEKYDPQRVEMIRKTLPPLATYAGETGPLDVHYAAFAWCKQHGAAFKADIKMDWDEVSDQDARILAGTCKTMDDDHPFASLWAFHINTAAGSWCVAYRRRLAASRLPAAAVATPARSGRASGRASGQAIGQASGRASRRASRQAGGRARGQASGQAIRRLRFLGAGVSRRSDRRNSRPGIATGLLPGNHPPREAGSAATTRHQPTRQRRRGERQEPAVRRQRADFGNRRHTRNPAGVFLPLPRRLDAGLGPRRRRRSRDRLSTGALHDRGTGLYARPREPPPGLHKGLSKTARINTSPPQHRSGQVAARPSARLRFPFVDTRRPR